MSRKPCKECPFARHCPPGQIGGADPMVYVGQVLSHFFLPCHMDPAYDQNRPSLDVLQCAGAAMFRSNIDVDCLMPPQILTLPEDREKVFGTLAEFMAHHIQISVEEAERRLKITKPAEWMQRALSSPGVKHFLVWKL